MITWIKLSTQTFDDEKIKIIESLPGGDTILVIWFKLLSQAGKNNLGGCVCLNESTPYNPNLLSILFNKQIAIINSALKTFQDFQMIEIDEHGFIFILNWERHQNEDKLLKIREQTRERVAKYRLNQKQKLLSNGCNVTLDGMEQKTGFSVESHQNDEYTLRAENANLEQNQGVVTLQPALRNAIDIDKEYNIYTQILNLWNEQSIIKHRNLNKSTKRKINSKVNEYSLEEIKTAILNYAIILKSDEYFFNYKWTLKDFLERGLEKFLDLEIAKSNYSKQTSKAHQNRSINESRTWRITNGQEA